VTEGASKLRSAKAKRAEEGAAYRLDEPSSTEGSFVYPNRAETRFLGENGFLQNSF
jgi:hypothetical protein